MFFIWITTKYYETLVFVGICLDLILTACVFLYAFHLLLYINMKAYSLIIVYICWYLIFVDIGWYLLIFVDIGWYSLIFVDICSYLVIFVDICWCLIQQVEHTKKSWNDLVILRIDIYVNAHSIYQLFVPGCPKVRLCILVATC